MVLGDVILQAKLVEQGILVRRQFPHHRRRSLLVITAGDYLMWLYLQGVFQHNILEIAVPKLVSDRKNF
jgi:hypothetical protein